MMTTTNTTTTTTTNNIKNTTTTNATTTGTNAIQVTSFNPTKDKNNDIDHKDDDDKLIETVPVRRRNQKTPTTSSSSSLPSCQMCHTQPSRYTCPRCYIHTCSLFCCQRHKTQHSCNGQRDLTQYIPLSQMNDRWLVSDYHFLQNGTQTMDTTRRLWNQMMTSNTNATSLLETNDHHPNTNKRPRHDHPSTTNATGTSSSSSSQLSRSTHPLLLPPAMSTTNTTRTLHCDGIESEHSFEQISSLSLIKDHHHTSSSQPPQNQQTPISSKFSNAQKRSHHYHNNKTIPFTPSNLSQYNQIQLLVLPNIMERHQTNQSHYTTTVVSSASMYTSPTTATNMPVLHWTMEICFVTFSSSPLSPNDDNNNPKFIPVSTPHNDHHHKSVATIVLHSIPETITIHELQKQAAIQLQYQQAHQPQTIQRSSNSFPNVTITDNNVHVDTGSNRNNSNTTYLWWMKQIPCPAHDPIYIPIATTTADCVIPDSVKDGNITVAGGNSDEEGTLTQNDTTTTRTATTTLKDVLRNRTIIEFPTIYIISQDDYASSCSLKNQTTMIGS